MQFQEWHSTSVAADCKTPPSQSSESDAILVCAGGLTSSGGPNSWVQARLETAARLYQIKNQPILCLGGGTYHKAPILNRYNFVIHESTSCASALLKMGIPAREVLKEWSSYDTIGNAWFAFINYILPFEWKSCVVVTSNFHMPRVKKLFEWVKSVVNSDCMLHFVKSPDNMDEEILALRSSREAASCQNIDILSDRIKSAKEFTQWLYFEHNAYAVAEEVDTRMVNEKLANSY